MKRYLIYINGYSKEQFENVRDGIDEAPDIRSQVFLVDASDTVEAQGIALHQAQARMIKHAEVVSCKVMGV